MICVVHDDNTVDKTPFNKEELNIEADIENLPQLKVLKEIFKTENKSRPS